MKNKTVFILILFMLVLPFILRKEASAAEPAPETPALSLSPSSTEMDIQVLPTDGNYLAGEIKEAGQVDAYRIQLPQQGRLTLTFQGLSIRNSSYCLSVHQDLTEKTILRGSVLNSGADNPLINTKQAYLEAGTYYCLVYGLPHLPGIPSGSTGTYRIKAVFEKSTSTEKEPNDAFDTAGELLLNEEIIGFNSYSDETDFFKFHVPEKKTIWITFTAALSGLFSLSFYNQEYEPFSSPSPEVKASTRQTGYYAYTYSWNADPGTYYIKMYHGTGDSRLGLYGLQYTEIPVPDPVPATNPVISWLQSQVGKASPTPTPTVPAKPDLVVVGQLIYKIEKSGAIVVGPKNRNAKSLTIPAVIKIGQKTCKVTQIAPSALKDMKKLAKLTIGKNVKKIGKQAVANCPKLKTLTIESRQLTTGRVKAGAFKKNEAIALVKCPKGKTADYQKLLTSRGIKKTARFK